ncbi:hypothetical protein SSU98_1297 [Streptococcus suis 98HAH33]|nr:hypothetical protein SSU05_1283 [Streptococcus suis 05ZYH33]ABP92455.1 hypothetical protein SSU98_1297 [Streptococcus suis 98HAH33]
MIYLQYLAEHFVGTILEKHPIEHHFHDTNILGKYKQIFEIHIETEKYSLRQVIA